ncbi:MAG: hypothetical protein BGO50_01780 [Rhodanobacter sp. 67-28]|nr:MAG: hypothetical protein BGO50_01780 [Rhodanobacter sp. 67-28]
MKITPASLPQGDVRIYEFGARLDKDCLEAANDQFFKAHQLYNELVACMQGTLRDMQAYLLENAGQEAQSAQARVEALNEALSAAKAANDEDTMKAVASERREVWRTLAALLRDTRKVHKATLQERFLCRIGRKSTCATYQLRCDAVAAGLGWATANATLDAALLAFKSSFVQGRAPRFAKAGESTQDSLTLQFTAAGGVSVSTLLEGRHTEFRVKASGGCGPRRYGTLEFRLGPASSETYAAGTWQYHRAMPDDGAVGLVRLVRRRLGPKFQWAIQFQVRSPLPVNDSVGERKPLVALHAGWAADLTGRRVAGIADGADPGLARVLQLPPEIEAGLQHSGEVESARSVARDNVVATLKAHAWPQDLLDAAEQPTEDATPEATRRSQAAADLLVIRRLPATHVAIRRLHRLAQRLRDTADLPDWFEAWRKEDKLAWQKAAHAAKRARNRRKGFYREVALGLATGYQAIVLQPLDLESAAKKVDDASGERTEFGRKARSGRVVAAIYELEGAIRWAAAKCGTAVLELTGETAGHCAYCGGAVKPVEDDSQRLACTQCGADIDRKRNGAALAWQATEESLPTLVEDFWRETLAARDGAAAKRKEKREKVAEARRASRVVE